MHKFSRKDGTEGHYRVVEGQVGGQRVSATMFDFFGGMVCHEGTYALFASQVFASKA